MIGKIRNVRLGIFLNVGIGIVFIIAAVIIVITVNHTMRQQALIEAQSKARIILDRNLATHAYFSQIMKPSIFAWSEPFRSKDYFDHTWMSSTYAIREIEKYFKSFNPSGYSFKDSALNARSPENEADAFERAFIEKMNADKKLESESIVRDIDGKPYLVVLRRGESMEASCLRCHSHPQNAPKGLTDYYGSERSFNRKTGDVISAVSLRIPLSEAYAAANVFSLKLSVILLAVLACLFTIQYGFYKRYLLEPLNVMRDKANRIATHEGHLGDQIPQPFGRELSELTATFNEMSVKLRHDRDHLEELVDQRTEELRKEKVFTESIIQTAQTIVLILDTTGHIVSINPYMEDISSYTLKEVQGKNWFSTFLPEDRRDQVRKLFLKAISDIQTRGNIYPIVTKDGRELQIEWYDKTLKDEKGNVLGLLAIGQDITDRKRAEDALSNSERKYRNIFENATEGIFQSTPEGRYISVNPAFARIGGYNSPDEMIDMVIDIQKKMYVHQEDRARLLELLDKQDIINNFEAEIRRRDNAIIWISMNVKAIRDQGGKIILLEGTIEDITDRKQAEEKIKTSLLEKETMLKEIHHRVKNNLQVISSLLALQSSYLQDEKAREMFQESQDRVKVMANIHTMLYQSADLARVDFGGFIRDLAGRLQQSYGIAESPVEIHVNVADVSLTIETSIPCGLILNELVSNALKHAFPFTGVRAQRSGVGGQEKEQKGEIAITLREELTPPSVIVSEAKQSRFLTQIAASSHHEEEAGLLAMTENGYGSPLFAPRFSLITLTVSDNGIGFPEGVDFRNTKSLGMELVNLLVGQINGTIDMQVEGGATFTITFPAYNYLTLSDKPVSPMEAL